MRIKIKAVDLTQPAGKKFKNLEVIFANERGETKSWNLKDFANPDTFKVLSNAKSGEEYDIVAEKDAKDFTQWRSATPASGAAGGGSAPPFPSRAQSIGPAKSNYETSEERAARQVLIVRQSCLAQAVAFAIARDGSAGELNLGNTLEIADAMVQWVFQKDDNAVFSAEELAE